MNRKINTLIGLVVVFALIAQIGMTVNSNPGYHSGAQCGECHNEPATAIFDGYATSTLTLDGNGTEAYWEDYTGRRNMLPVAGNFGADRMMFEIIFAQNSTHLFMYMEIDTHLGYALNNGTAWDGVSIMWGIDSDELNFNMEDGMVLEDGSADLWYWKPATTDDGKFNQTLDGSIKDWAIDDGGWDKSEDDTDVMQAAGYRYQMAHGHMASWYTIELVRPLTTAETTHDVQFVENKFYDYSVAVWMEAENGKDHLMGFSHQVYVEGGVDPALTTVEVTANETVTLTETKSETPLAIGFFFVSLLSTVAIMAITKKRN